MIVISNLAEKVDRRFLGENEKNLWNAIPYQTDNFDGVMLGGGDGVDLPPIEIDLSVKGKYRIWLGTYGFATRYKIRTKLSHDLCFQTLGPTYNPDPQIEYVPVLYELFWREADITGQNLILEGCHTPSYQGALAYIRLEPIEEFTGQGHCGKVEFPLAITNDGGGIFFTTMHRKPEDLLEPLESIPEDSSMRIFLWGNGDSDVCNYPTKVGNCHHFTPGRSLNYNTDLRARNHELWQRKGWDSMKVVRDYAAKRGWEFHVYIRMETFSAQFPIMFIRSKFFDAHPEYHCRDCEGRKVLRLSYAYPEVQKHMLDLIQEISDYNPDGINLCLIRGVPLVLYEPIMIEGFQKEYGMDPRTLDELDEHWLSYQAGVLTGFIEKTKAILKPSQRLSVTVPANEFDCRKWGLDIAEWVKRGLIDDLYPVGQVFSPYDVHLDKPENLDFDYFNTLIGREKIRLIPMLYPWQKFVSDYDGWKKIILSFKEKGADAYAVWDAIECHTSSRFERADHIGSDYKNWRQAPEFETRRVTLRTLNGFRFDRYHYFEIV